MLKKTKARCWGLRDTGRKMTVAEKIMQHLKDLSERAQAEVLDFIRSIETRTGKASVVAEDSHWSAFSLSQAMRDIEDEDSPYSEADC
jgi:hypothetical protein